MGWKLKVLSGVHYDSEIELFGDTISIGSDALQADIVLSDSYIQAVHITLTIDEDTLILTQSPSSEAIKFGSEIIRTDIVQNDEDSHESDSVDDALGFEIPMGKKITIGKLVFAVVRSEDQWPDFTIDKIADTEIIKEKKYYKVRNKKNVFIIFFVSLGILLCIIWLTMSTTADNSLNDVQKKEQYIQTINHYLQQQNYSNVTIDWNTVTDKMTLQGYVNTDKERNNILNQLKNLNGHYEFNIFSNQSILQGMRFILNNYGYQDIIVAVGKEPGIMFIKGNIATNKKWETIEKHMTKDVPGLLGWHIEQPNQDAKTRLTQWLKELGLAERYTVNIHDDRIELAGSVQKSDKEALNKLETLYEKHYPNGLKLQLTAEQVETRPQSINFTIKSVTLGTEPHLTLTDNRIYFPGSLIPGGFVIYAITHDHITLLKGETRLLITIRNIDHDKAQHDQP